MKKRIVIEVEENEYETLTLLKKLLETTWEEILKAGISALVEKSGGQERLIEKVKEKTKILND